MAIVFLVLLLFSSYATAANLGDEHAQRQTALMTKAARAYETRSHSMQEFVKMCRTSLVCSSCFNLVMGSKTALEPGKPMPTVKQLKKITEGVKILMEINDEVTRTRQQRGMKRQWDRVNNPVRQEMIITPIFDINDKQKQEEPNATNDAAALEQLEQLVLEQEEHLYDGRDEL